MGVVQMNTVELHTWNATRDKIERPDRFVLDLDPGEGVPGKRCKRPRCWCAPC
jgi:bifunctional non-homologous end joining protein LigD